MRYVFKAEFFKALAHPLRIQILDALRAGPISVGELRERLGVEQSTLSQQLAVLRSRNFVRTQRAGTTIRYEIGDPAIWQLLDSARVVFDNQLVNVRSVLEDLAREDVQGSKPA
ncbi:MAG TPA: metalloregulator ArsR/SmtB family transcription factor [Candidatus Baltobacteraceae bacterium]|jgi:ArsR family transcriptional regulator|nr:metalloregulator ArsR/SmtB family transcription factor [Candidatus Baltobacteraceae bacterium]